MAEIIPLDKIRTDKMPHTSGIAICLDCKHEWISISPFVGEDQHNLWLECPECNLIKGRYKYAYDYSDDHWACNCENDLFHVTLRGVYCPNCGVWQEGF